MAEPKQYINGIWIRSHRFEDGNEILNLSVSGRAIDGLCQTLKGLAAESGWARLVISPRKNPDEKSTHSIFVDTYKPKSKAVAQATQPPAEAQTAPTGNDDDVPF
jgi:hypothetical protein